MIPQKEIPFHFPIPCLGALRKDNKNKKDGRKGGREGTKRGGKEGRKGGRKEGREKGSKYILRKDNKD